MKHNLGRILFLLLAFALSLSADTYSWEAQAKKSQLYLNEAVEVEYICRFEGEGYQYVIEFTPPKEGDGYRMYRLSETERIVNEQRINRYRFVIFFEKSGRQTLTFNALMRYTSKESIEDTVLGRDNVEDFSFTDTKAVLPTLNFDIIEHDAVLSGRYALTVKMDSKSVNAYESIPLTIKVEGVGDFDRFIPFKLEIEGVDIFREEPQKTLELTKEGFKGTWSERYALIPKNDFELPEFKLRYFDPILKQEKVLKSESIKIRVTGEIMPEELLNSEEETASTGWNWSALYYLLTLITGIIIGRYLRIELPVSKEDGTLYSPLHSCRDPKRFLTLLVLLNDPAYDSIISELDQQVKQGGKINLDKYKKYLENGDNIIKKSKINLLFTTFVYNLFQKSSTSYKAR
ncbi:MAG: hypothetical protein DRG24_06115 [Epsilonproteobacteria bacterium]|nr:MAG: hypothetical protein DRG24_06115 [Campylobacterota bacterium]